ncbi:MAG: amidase family protein [Motilibacteraceae bacterium]
MTAPLPSALPRPAGLDLGVATVAELADALAAGRTTAVELARAYLARIEAVDRNGPGITSIRCVCPDALEQAEASDARRTSGGVRGRLDGVPVLVKDNVDVAGVPTTAGTVALAASVPAVDAPLVARLREAGAVVLGKTNLTELANFMTEGMPSGYSSLGGQVLNPYDTSVTPSGSSSGSGAAVALGLAAVAVGSETDGSITSPADHQSLVGFKPTLGLVSRTGILPIASSQDTAGPMARTVADAAALLTAIAGPDADDPATSDAASEVDYVAALSADALRGARLGVVDPPADLADGQREVHERAVEELRAAGTVLVEGVTMPQPPWEPELAVLHHEFGRDVDAYLARLPEGAPIRSLRELAEWNRAHADVALKYGQTHVDAALAIDHAGQGQVHLARRAADVERTRTHGIEAALRGHDVEALVFAGASGCSWAARAGCPSVVVPAGYTAQGRRPVGLMLVGPRWGDARLLALAHAYEQATRHRRTPWEVNPAPYRGTSLGRT